jgi:hypothetical protein
MPLFWVIVLLTVVAALLPVVSVRAYTRLASPPLYMRVQEIEHLPAHVAKRLLVGLSSDSYDVALSESSPLLPSLNASASASGKGRATDDFDER